MLWMLESVKLMILMKSPQATPGGNGVSGLIKRMRG